MFLIFSSAEARILPIFTSPRLVAKGEQWICPLIIDNYSVYVLINYQNLLKCRPN